MRVIDLFSGCGGMSLGFLNAGFDIAAAFDNWQAAIDVYTANFKHPVFNSDLNGLTDYSLIQQFEPEMIIGGPPCQDFSSAGKRNESLGRADLTYKFSQIVSAVSPSWFVMENVDRIIKSQVLKDAKGLLQKAGYGLTEIILNANFCGVPQNRKRYFLIGELNGKDNAILPYLEKNQQRKPFTIYDYLGDSLGIEYYYRHPRSYKRRAIFSIHEPSPTIRGVNRPIPSTYQPHKNDASPVTAALRPLTTIERSYLQTFPATFKFDGTKTDLEQMIGNAVPVKQAEFVARCIKEYVQDKEKTHLEREAMRQLQLSFMNNE
jgi:DNA (cytosine-5)-methyltransferase 1